MRSGDSPVQIRSSEIQASHMNFSLCKGAEGDCCIDSTRPSNSIVSFMNVESCHEYSICGLPGSLIKLSNLINNTLDGFLFYVYFDPFTIEDCYFHGNTNADDRMPDRVTYTGCYGDIHSPGYTAPNRYNERSMYN